MRLTKSTLEVQRRDSLRAWASGERTADSDVVARLALSEIEELDLRIAALQKEAARLRALLKHNNIDF